MQTDNNHLMRIRLISDILEDYQDNIRRVLRLIETEQSIVSQDASANHTYGNIFVNVDASSLTYENESSPVNPRPPTLSAALTPRVGVIDDLVWSVENDLQIIQKNGNVILKQYDEYREDLTLIDNPQSHYTIMFWNNDEYN